MVLLGQMAWAETLPVVTEEFPPYNFTTQDGQRTGACTEIIRLTLAEAGLDPEVQVLPWARAYDTAMNNPGVLIYTILRTKKREDSFYWIGPLVPALAIHFYRLASRSDIQVDW